jgi:hypothetical protein
MRPILFIDRDGVILQEPKTDFQIDHIEKTSFVPGVITNLHKIATELGFYKVMVTNQDGLGTEAYPTNQFEPFQQLMIRTLAAEDFIFDEKPVSEVFYLLEKMYGITVIYDFNVMGNCYLTANLTDESLFKKLDLICKITHSTYEKTDAQIIIHSEGCLK